MDSLRDDFEEVAGAPDRVRRFVRDRRRRAGCDPGEPSTWYAYLEVDHPSSADRLLVTLGRSPGDVLHTAMLWARARLAIRRGVGRWLVENNAGVEGEGSVFLTVEAAYDPEAPRYDE